MTLDIRDFADFEAVQRSKRGDHNMLIALLRSKEEIPVAIRRYLADELAKEPKKRFSRKTQRDLVLEERDKEVIRLVAAAKLNIAWKIMEPAFRSNDWTRAKETFGPYVYFRIEEVRWGHIPTAAALDLLAEQGHDIDDDRLKNAINRRRRDKNDWDQEVKLRPLLTFWI